MLRVAIVGKENRVNKTLTGFGESQAGDFQTGGLPRKLPCGNSLDPLENKASREIHIAMLTQGRGIGVWGKGGGNRPLSPGEGSREGLALPLGGGV